MAEKTGPGKTVEQTSSRKTEQEIEQKREQPPPGAVPKGEIESLAAGETPPSLHPRTVLALQRLVGNQEIGRLLGGRPPALQRGEHDQPLTTQPGGSLEHPVMGAPVAQQGAARLRPLSDADRRTLEEMIPGTPILLLINQRDERLRELQGRREETSRALPPGGLPEAGSEEAERLETLEPEVGGLQEQVERLNGMIQAALAELHIEREEQLVNLVSEQFPRIFERRAQEIAVNELEHNREIVLAEAERYGLRPGENAASTAQSRNELRAAAREIVDRDRRIETLRTEITTERQAETTGRPITAGTTSRSVGRMNEVTTLQHERQRVFDAYATRFPILHRVQPQDIVTADESRLNSLMGPQIDELLRNIEQTQVNIRSGDLLVWDLPTVVNRTTGDLRVGENRVLAAAIDNHVRQTRSNRDMVRIGVAALGITAGIVSGIATGGLSLAAGGVALGTSLYQATESVQSYLVEASASDVALDRRIADISRQEPELAWVLLDLAGVVMDATQVVRIFRQLRSAARAVLETGDVEAFARTARRVAPTAANQLIASAAHEASVAGALVNTIEAAGDAFRRVDMQLIIGELEAFAERGYAHIVADLHAWNRIHPLTEESLQSVLGADLASTYITQGCLRYSGFYDDSGVGRLFIRPGVSLEEISGTIIHETTHYLQDLYGLQVRGFKAEFQAFCAERDYLFSIERVAGRDAIDSLPEFYRQLRNMTDDEIGQYILTNPAYQSLGYINPESINYEEAVMEILRTVQRFEVGGRGG